MRWLTFRIPKTRDAISKRWSPRSKATVIFAYLNLGAATFVAPSLEGSHFGMVPRWFVGLLGITPLTARVPITIAGQNDGSILIETDPNNEILEVWNDLGDGFVVLALFFGLNILLIYVYIGRALRPLDRLAGALQQIGQGDYKLRIGGHMVPELSRLQWSFNRMATELAELDGEKRRLNEQLLTLQEEDRREIARDLHDEISPFLFAVNAGLTSISRLVHQGRSAEIAGEIRSTSEPVSHITAANPDNAQPLAPRCSGRFRLGRCDYEHRGFLAPPSSGNPLHHEPSTGGGKLRRFA